MQQLNFGDFPSVLAFNGAALIFLGFGSFYMHANANKDGLALSEADKDNDGFRDGGVGYYMDCAGVFLVVMALVGSMVLIFGITSGYLNRKTVQRNKKSLIWI